MKKIMFIYSKPREQTRHRVKTILETTPEPIPLKCSVPRLAIIVYQLLKDALGNITYVNSVKDTNTDNSIIEDERKV